MVLTLTENPELKDKLLGLLQELIKDTQGCGCCGTTLAQEHKILDELIKEIEELFVPEEEVLFEGKSAWKSKPCQLEPCKSAGKNLCLPIPRVK